MTRPLFRTALAVAAAALVASSYNAHAGLWEEGYEAYQRKDYASAVAQWRVVAQSGNREAQSLVGLMYFQGQGVAQNYPQAIEWLLKAAAQGEPKAQFKLGSMYANGQGFTRDYQRAAMWFVIAADSGHPNASKELTKASAELSDNEIAIAKRLAKTCVKREFKDC
ncbi:MAG: tetratricopeptide repeat protein [Betaproteobacteria bacterium]